MNYLQNFYEDLKPVYLLINNNLCRKLASSIELPIIFDNNLNVIPLSFLFFFDGDFNLFNCESENFTFTLSYCAILY